MTQPSENVYSLSGLRIGFRLPTSVFPIKNCTLFPIKYLSNFDHIKEKFPFQKRSPNYTFICQKVITL